MPLERMSLAATAVDYLPRNIIMAIKGFSFSNLARVEGFPLNSMDAVELNALSMQRTLSVLRLLLQPCLL